MKKTLLLILTFSSLFCFSQKENSIFVKGNLLLAPIGVINVGLEYQLSSKYTLQGDFLISPWKSISGNHAQIYFGNVEGRYYFKEAFQHWYVGLNAGSGLFDVTKYNYFDTSRYQKGIALTFGATVGYQFQWRENWNIDIFLGGGTVQSFYRGYEETPTTLTRYDAAEKLNKSGEFLPYKGGIMISYKLR
ncbi:DUF3575 domain-containing protein [Frigoriflavimonas asaccharolytica]|uniref:DUF3575 domain-containing protein n=1 Tax=Frigoriflavimonas asaccharolytica TaxID=2735899 RepID=A0A8J8G9F8_9FLAO|nr:DUF3575 domain-containing protein [Frigoriflavimonas asaccharolytica]NRS93110.1 hypothetical protein [Frigoriflavimonas asaccharolytica]